MICCDLFSAMQKKSPIFLKVIGGSFVRGGSEVIVVKYNLCGFNEGSRMKGQGCQTWYLRNLGAGYGSLKRKQLVCVGVGCKCN